jgi:hypothetical protein
VFVWNDTQKREAIEMHRVPADRIAVTGAQCFRQMVRSDAVAGSRDVSRGSRLAARRPARALRLLGAVRRRPPEAPFVVEWIRRVRAHASPLRTAPILVRPHPARMREWDSIDVGELPGVAVWGGDPKDSSSRDDYFDSLFHSTVVVGLNTSAFIEAGIVGRPIHTVLLPEWHESQMGTLHFRYLLEESGGC